jgi:hypothetical protein
MRTVRYSSPGLKTRSFGGAATIEILARNPLIIGCLFAGAIIAACLTCFLCLTQTPSSKANLAPIHASSEIQSAHSTIALKGNRPDRANVTADRTFHSRSKIEVVNGNRKVPIGCEVAFSRLVAKDNVPVRCVT